jgi:hypothetical protein
MKKHPEENAQPYALDRGVLKAMHSRLGTLLRSKQRAAHHDTACPAALYLKLP